MGIILSRDSKCVIICGGIYSFLKCINYSSFFVFYCYYFNDCFVICFVNEGIRKIWIVCLIEKIIMFLIIIKRDENL